jgi:hypothetical protein
VADLTSRTAPSTLPWSWYSDPGLLGRKQELSEKLIAQFQAVVREAFE